MTVSRITTGLALIGAAFILYIGVGYLVAPAWMAHSFGLPAWPHGQAAAFMNLKGVRDVTSGVVILALLIARQRFALGVAMLAFSLTPLGDMLTVLTHHGSVATALSVHFVTAALVILTGVLLIRDSRTAPTAIPQPVAVPA
ncbi:DUF4267 domain-containing protein [Nocardia sp. NEAU-G5]|uniref:DUF4267 domain-containing protein n=1 Tax=Nocardia albiluteola TaxID=2842303 RepID=A0ABS6B112_9NOCA|nr:DUF4267 domain-containing protein [Nocardia albiluteola]MBU3063436.1 DUF4267 domain-containing protein [Nocardia albiluteola]